MIIANIFLIVSGCYSQKYVVHTYTEEDGLPSSNINSISQDSSGIIWMATRNGLCSYDSHKWKEYYSNNGIPFKNTIKVKVDEKSKVWILQYFTSLDNDIDGISLSKFDDDKWKSYSVKLPYLYTLQTHLTSFDLSTYKNTTIASLGVYQLGVYLFINGNWKFFDGRKGEFPTTNIYSTYVDRGDVYITTDIGIF